MQNQAENEDKPCLDSVVAMVIFYLENKICLEMGGEEERMELSASKGVGLLN